MDGSGKKSPTQAEGLSDAQRTLSLERSVFPFNRVEIVGREASATVFLICVGGLFARLGHLRAEEIFYGPAGHQFLALDHLQAFGERAGG
jgi:hypothetical protein